VQINENLAKAAIKQAEGVRDSTRIQADGNAAAIRMVGEAQADAYHAQATSSAPTGSPSSRLWRRCATARSE